MSLKQTLVLFHRAPGKTSKVGRKPVGSAQGNWTTQLQPANKTRKPVACTFHGKCIPCIFLSWQCLSCFHSGNYKCRTNAIHLGPECPSSQALTEVSVTLRSGMDTRHGTQVFSLLMRRVSGLLINGCSKSVEKIRGEQLLKKKKKSREKATTSRKGGFLNFLNAAQASQKEWC